MLGCMMLTHDYDFSKDNGYKGNPHVILSYDYVKANAPYLTKEQKEFRDAYSKQLGETIANGIVDGFNEGKYKSMSLSQFRKAEPKTKQVKYEIKNGKAVRVYHIKDYEVIYINNQCTSVTKF